MSPHLKEDPIAGEAKAAWQLTLVHGEAGNLNNIHHMQNIINT